MSYYATTYEPEVYSRKVSALWRSELDDNDVTQSGQYLPGTKSLLSIDLSVEDYDLVLCELIKAALSDIEQYTSIGMVPQDVTVRYVGYDGGVLPFGPVWSDPVPTLTKSYTGATVVMADTTGTSLSEDDFPVLNDFSSGSISYTSGYSMIPGDPFPMPAGLRAAVCEHAAAAFRANGVSGVTPNTYWKTLAAKFRRF